MRQLLMATATATQHRETLFCFRGRTEINLAKQHEWTTWPTDLNYSCSSRR